MNMTVAISVALVLFVLLPLETSGRIASILPEVGTLVMKGDLLAVLETDRIEAALNRESSALLVV